MEPAPPQPTDLGLSRPYEDLGLSTRLISLRLKKKELHTEPVVTPIYQTTVYHRVPKHGFISETGEWGYLYQRIENPNCDEAAMLLNSIEGGAGSILYPSGMSALSSTLMCFLKPGDHVIAGSPLYSTINVVFDTLFPQYNINVSYVPSYGTVEDYRQAVKPNTKILYGETICNPMMWVLDIEEFGKLGKELGIMTVVDATFSTPINQNLISYGIDAVVHSSTKYIAGHSDMLSGCTTLRTTDQYNKLKTWTILTGPTVSPTEAVMFVRSLRTLNLRMQKFNENGLAVANFLEKHPAVKEIYYCGLESHPDFEIAKRLMKGCGGMMAVVLGSKDQAICVVENVKIFTSAGSLGGVESLVCHPSTTSHAALTAEMREKAGIRDTLLRISVGIEEVEDFIDDLNLALNKALLLHPV